MKRKVEIADDVASTTLRMKDAWVAHHLAAAAFERVQRCADANEIRILPVKGVLTAHLFYDDPAERTIADIDFKICARDVGRLLQAGRRAGWVVLRYSRAYNNLVFNLGGISVDIEASVGPPGLCGLRVEDMLIRSVRRKGAFKFDHLEPEIHDHALTLVVNVFKDQLIHANRHALVDVARVVERDDFSLDRFVDLTRASHVTTLVWIVSNWMAMHHASDRWRMIRSALGPPPRSAYAHLLMLLLQSKDPASFALRVSMRMASERPLDRIRALVSAFAFTAEQMISK